MKRCEHPIADPHTLSFASAACDVSGDAGAALPSWVPEPVERYLAHTVAGQTIRQVARRDGCHASTVLRQIRRIETRRDDPLVDKALLSLGSRFFRRSGDASYSETHTMRLHADDAQILTDAAALDREAFRVLRRMTETGSVLAVAEGMETAVVVREGADGSTTRTATIAAAYVSAMALNDWIMCEAPARISRYKITPAGRSHLAHLAGGAGAAQPGESAPFAEQHRTMDTRDIVEDGKRRKIRYNAAESPVTALARRKDKDGSLFLCDGLVGAAERLREDFELAQMGPRVTQNWDAFLTGSDKTAPAGGSGPDRGPSAARARVSHALRYLGPGLGDVALRCCCYLEGLESAEKRMGWSARSGKIDLRIALQRLRHF